MKIALYSDLHLERGGWEPPATAQEADVIVLAGDISAKAHGLEWAGRKFPRQPIIYVAGNHEFYDCHLHLLDEMRKPAWAQMDIHFMENRTVELDGVRFLGCTLWSGFDLYGAGTQQALAMTAAQRCINDYWLIRGNDGKPLEPGRTLSMHRKSVAWLERELAKSFDGRTVVVTHFAPHRGCVAPWHAGSNVTPYFVTDLAWLMDKHRIDVWCYGHTHTNADFITESGCRVVSNQLGYPGERIRTAGGIRYETGFRNDLLIEV